MLRSRLVNAIVEVALPLCWYYPQAHNFQNSATEYLQVGDIKWKSGLSQVFLVTICSCCHVHPFLWSPPDQHQTEVHEVHIYTWSYIEIYR